MKMKKLLFITIVVFAVLLMFGCDGITSKRDISSRSGTSDTDEMENPLYDAFNDYEAMGYFVNMADWWFRFPDNFNCYTKSTEEMKQMIQVIINQNTDAGGEILPEWKRLVIGDAEYFFTKKYEPGFVTEKGKPQATELVYYKFDIVDPEAKEGQLPGFAVMCSDSRAYYITFFTLYNDYGSRYEYFIGEYYPIEVEPNTRLIINAFNRRYILKLSEGKE